MNKKLVYICSPLKGDLEGNMARAVGYAKAASEENVIPLAPHTIFTQFLNDLIPEERERGLELGVDLLKRCDEIWVYGDRLSEGMKNEILIANALGIPVIAKQMCHETYTELLALQGIFKERFTHAQWGAMCEGLDRGLNISLLAHPGIEVPEMEALVNGLTERKDLYQAMLSQDDDVFGHCQSFMEPVNDREDYEYLMEA